MFVCFVPTHPRVSKIWRLTILKKLILSEIICRWWDFRLTNFSCFWIWDQWLSSVVWLLSIAFQDHFAFNIIRLPSFSYCDVIEEHQFNRNWKVDRTPGDENLWSLRATNLLQNRPSHYMRLSHCNSFYIQRSWWKWVRATKTIKPSLWILLRAWSLLWSCW